jgi:hypothetical protein
MFKVSSTAIGKLALGIDRHHFELIDARYMTWLKRLGRI